MPPESEDVSTGARCLYAPTGSTFGQPPSQANWCSKTRRAGPTRSLERPSCSGVMCAPLGSSKSDRSCSSRTPSINNYKRVARAFKELDVGTLAARLRAAGNRPSFSTRSIHSMLLLFFLRLRLGPDPRQDTEPGSACAAAGLVSASWTW